MSTPELPPGTVVDGKYTVGRVLRTRQGATTAEATNASGQTVALTVYDASCFPSGLVLERSLRELRQLQSVQSDRVVKVLGVGKHGDGIFEVTEPTPEQTLADHLAGGALPLPDAAALIVQVGEALLEAQKAGVIHRDLGAAVIYPSPDGAKVGGFAVGEPNGGQSFGPLETIAPEQVAGKVVDQRTLVYNVAALMHWMLQGTPMFDGDPAAVLQDHASSEPPASVHPSLERALGKDPRMRPMMLKQFLWELAKVGGVEPPKTGNHPRAPSAPAAAPSVAPAGSKPSSRGWTMFMQEQDDDATGGAAKPAAPEPPAAKPSTRGWTMFMQAQDDDGDGSADAAEPATPATPAAPEPDAPKPSTRGWTMFMQAQDDDAAASPEPVAKPSVAKPSVAKPSAAKPVAAAKPKPSAPPAGPAKKPSTRGWTMFMSAQDEEEEAASQEEAKPAAPAAPAKPSARGWTMFTNAEDEDEDEAAAAVATATPGGASAPAKAAEGDDKPAPSTRGWTMFMEPGDKPAAAAPTPDSAPPSQPAGAAPDAPKPGGKSRGWTMFMDAPLSEGEKPQIPGPQAPVPAEPAAPMESDTKGWTVFGAPSPVAHLAKQAAAAPDRGGLHKEGSAIDLPKETMVVTEPPAGTASPGAVSPAHDDAVNKGKTMIATGAPAGALEGAASGPMAFAGNDGSPEPKPSPRDVTMRDISAPISVGSAEARAIDPVVAQPSAPVPLGATEMAPQKSGSKVVFVVIGVAVVVGIVAGTVFALI